jgi:hypothetical protein
VGIERLHGELPAPLGVPTAELADELLTRPSPERPEDDVALIAVRLNLQARCR